MAFDHYQADRIRAVLKEKSVVYEERKMMGGLCVMVNEKMCFGLLQSKTDGQDLLMIRVGEESCQKIINDAYILPMDFTGRPMKGYAFVSAEGFDMDEDISKWIQMCLDYNPLAKKSPKKKKAVKTK